MGLVAACGDDDAGTGSGADDVVEVVVTTDVLGDLVAQVVGAEATVTVLIPSGAAPHDFQPSARDADLLRRADVVVANGGGFEEGLTDVLDAAVGDGVEVVEALDLVDAVTVAAHDHGHEDEHGDEHDDHEEHDDEPVEDPHFLTDPLLAHDLVLALPGVLSARTGLALADLERRADAAATALDGLHDELVDALVTLPTERRLLVTTHDVLRSFAARYDFDVVGTIIEGGSPSGAPSSGHLAELAETIEERDIPAVFTEPGGSPAADTLAAEVDGLQVVELYTESLGRDGSGAETYAGMQRTNVARIVDALDGGG